MDNLQVFTKDEFGSIRTIEKLNKDKYTGFFYVLEWDNKVKIGSTKNPYQRIMALKRSAENYGNSKIGRAALSVPHTNYVENEKMLHKVFKQNRKTGSELFDMDFEDVLLCLPDGLEYRDDSQVIDKRAESFMNGMKMFMFGGSFNG